MFVTLNDLYFATEMYDAMVALRKWKEENRDVFPDNLTPQLEGSRRLAKSYFARLFKLRERKLINKGNERLLVHEQQLDFLLTILAPIEKAKNPNLPTTDKRMYKHFEQLYADIMKNA